MVESATVTELEVMWQSTGEDFASLQINHLLPGCLVVAATSSGNHYLLEVVEPRLNRVRVYRREAREEAPAGYRGEREVSPILEVGECITFIGDHPHTTPVVRLTVLTMEKIGHSHA